MDSDKAASEVNSWAENQTKGLIKQVLSPDSVNNETNLILANALYFKGNWEKKFDASATKQADFHLVNGGSVKVPFMTTHKDQFLHHYQDFTVLRLPYKQGIATDRQFSMYVFLPDETDDGFLPLMDKLTSQPGYLKNHLPFRQVEVGEFMLPRFKISFEFEASSVLKSFGVEKPFSAGGVSEMVDYDGGLFVSGIFQKSFIEVNEEGTEAASVTAAIYRCTSYTPPVDFIADHPFIFLIREDRLVLC